MGPLNEEAISEELNTALTPYMPNEVVELALSRPPDVVLEEARRAAAALQRVIASKANVVKFNGKIYLTFEDWQMLGRFYGVSARVVPGTVRAVEFNGAQGFTATAIAVRSDGREIASAESMCLSDEANWKAKPLFQLASMAQTRACAKALRSVLSWVVVIAGYEPTPAEEMTGQEKAAVAQATAVQMPQRRATLAQQTLPATDAETATIENVLIKSCVSEDKKNAAGKEYRKWSIVFENGQTAGTITQSLADAAATFQFGDVPVTATVKKTRWGLDLLTLEEARERVGA